jgi:hypothetical protein
MTAFRIRSEDVKDILQQSCSDAGHRNISEATMEASLSQSQLQNWFSGLSTALMYITPGYPWANGYCEIFNSRMADELLNRELFDTIH